MLTIKTSRWAGIKFLSVLLFSSTFATCKSSLRNNSKILEEASNPLVLVDCYRASKHEGDLDPFASAADRICIKILTESDVNKYVFFEFHQNYRILNTIRTTELTTPSCFNCQEYLATEKNIRLQMLKTKVGEAESLNLNILSPEKTTHKFELSKIMPIN